MERESKDTALWKIAKKRAGFKYHLLIYMMVNIFFWALWFLTVSNETLPGDRYPWPLWPMCGWGIGIIFNYTEAYRSNDRLAEKEYQKLTFKQ